LAASGVTSLLLTPVVDALAGGVAVGFDLGGGAVVAQEVVDLVAAFALVKEADADEQLDLGEGVAFRDAGQVEEIIDGDEAVGEMATGERPDLHEQDEGGGVLAFDRRRFGMVVEAVIKANPGH
jgi:hypothetical protein